MSWITECPKCGNPIGGGGSIPKFLCDECYGKVQKFSPLKERDDTEFREEQEKTY